MKPLGEEYSESETVRRAEVALLRALSTPHKKQSEMKLGKRRVGVRQGAASQKPSVSGASCQADDLASREESKS